MTDQPPPLDITENRTGEDYLPLSEMMPGALDEIEAIGSRGGQMVGVPTGFSDLDAVLGGLRPGLVHVLFGATGIGASTLALDMARAAGIKHGLTAAIFSGQSPRTELINRLLSAEARIALHAIRSGTMQDDDWTRLARRMQEVAEAPLFIDDSSNISGSEIRAKCQRVKRDHDLRLAVIDGANHYARPTAPESLEDAQARLAADTKRLAIELQIPVIITAPANRHGEHLYGFRPAFADIASAYAETADVVIGLHRDDAYEKESPRAGEADLIVMKNRYGPTCTLTVAFQGHYSRFVDLLPEKSPQPQPAT